MRARTTTALLACVLLGSIGAFLYQVSRPDLDMPSREPENAGTATDRVANGDRLDEVEEPPRVEMLQLRGITGKRLPGDASRGLELTLSVANSTTGLHDVAVSVVNYSDKQVSLVANWTSNSHQGSYSDYLLRAIRFTSEPAIVPADCQTISAPRDRTLPQPLLTLEPRTSLVVRWRSGPDEVRFLSAGRAPCDDPFFPVPGCFRVAAEVQLTLGDGSRVRLKSNYAEVFANGADHPPKSMILSIHRVDPGTRTVELDAGSSDRLAAGDAYVVRRKGKPCFRLRVQHLTDSTATALVEDMQAQWSCGFPVVGERAYYRKSSE